jgi:hypothetical protein
LLHELDYSVSGKLHSALYLVRLIERIFFYWSSVQTNWGTSLPPNVRDKFLVNLRPVLSGVLGIKDLVNASRVLFLRI